MAARTFQSGRVRGQSSTSQASDASASVTGRGAPFKRLRVVGMGVLQTQSGFTIVNTGMPNQSSTMPMNSAVVTGSLGHHKPRPGGLKWKRSPAITQQGLQEMRGQKRMKTKAKTAELNYLSQTSSSAGQK
ncbi:uncharacterized protein LOC132638234 [Lycium barbarum]|uniref:uncharacterized protein LOC132638234 n=1 Tax=Lycium barbarum TaxID=112863 RepID=UPI00293E8DD4|nr:uncharacterized protein LOC132638234 [Lycium barbarum]